MDSQRHSTLVCVSTPDCEHQAILVAPKGATVAQPESPCSGILALPDSLSQAHDSFRTSRQPTSSHTSLSTGCGSVNSCCVGCWALW